MDIGGDLVRAVENEQDGECGQGLIVSPPKLTRQFCKALLQPELDGWPFAIEY